MYSEHNIKSADVVDLPTSCISYLYGFRKMEFAEELNHLTTENTDLKGKQDRAMSRVSAVEEGWGTVTCQGWVQGWC